MLHPDETLAQAQVWDGTWLVFHRCTAPSATTMQPANHSASTPGARQQPPAAAANPVVGWTSLESPKQPPAASPPDDAPKPADGFVWKPLDKDDT
jgi:hypothetical protein